MRREILADPDGPGDLKNSGQPASPSTTKKRRTGNTPNQINSALPDLAPPQPTTGFGETIVASNPFDDTVPAATTVAHPPVMPMPGMMPHHMPGPHLHSKAVPIYSGKNIGYNSAPGFLSEGKVYPPDQHMVFNPQNPNAPPIYICGACHKEVHDNDLAILCESGCNFWFHRICTGLTEAAFHLLTAEVYAEWVCDKCLSTKNIPLVKFRA